jgi:hypothetical protein
MSRNVNVSCTVWLECKVAVTEGLATVDRWLWWWLKRDVSCARAPESFPASRGIHCQAMHGPIVCKTDMCHATICVSSVKRHASEKVYVRFF